MVPRPSCMGFRCLFNVMEKLFTIYFPPFSLIARVLQKVRDDQVSSAIRVLPLWRNQPWLPTLLSVVVEAPARLPRWKNLLLLSPEGETHPISSLRLIACCVSGDPCNGRAYLDSLPCSFSHLSFHQQQNNTILHGTTGYLGVFRGKLIPIVPLSCRS